MCLIWKTVIRQTSTNCSLLFHNWRAGLLTALSLLSQFDLETLFFRSFTKAKWALITISGICFPFPQFVWSLASSPKSGRESSFSDFLCTWDRRYFTVPQAKWMEQNTTRELLRPTANLLYSKRTENRNAASDPLRVGTVSETQSPLLRVSLLENTKTILLYSISP